MLPKVLQFPCQRNIASTFGERLQKEHGERRLTRGNSPDTSGVLSLYFVLWKPRICIGPGSSSRHSPSPSESSKQHPRIIHFIELAAVWIQTLPRDEITREIEHGPDFLSVNTRDLPVSRPSICAVFDYSWEFLAEEESRVLLRLSVFHGGFQREAVEQVAGASLSTRFALVTKSLAASLKLRLLKQLRCYLFNGYGLPFC